MTWQREVTIQLLLLTIAVLVFWDLYAARTPSATISEVTILALYRFPMVAFAIGGILGHLTWPVQSTRPHWQTVILVICTLAAVVSGSILHLVKPTMPIIALALGIPYGHLIWPQQVSTETGASLLNQIQPSSIQTRTQSQTF